MDSDPSVGPLWLAFGIAGGVTFYGRFYLQWIASERARRSVVPIVFWYMSSAGSVMLMVFAFASQSPVGALGQCFNNIVYSRNLVHIWREQGRLTTRLHRVVHGSAALVVLAAIGMMGTIWWREFQINADRPAQASQQVWFWLALGVAGQALFTARLLVQWLVTEWRKRSVIPPAFWYLSLVAATLQAACFVKRAEWVFAAGMMATILIYARNLWFIRRSEQGV